MPSGMAYVTAMSVPKATMAVTTMPVNCAVLLGSRAGNRVFMPGTVTELRAGVKQVLNKWLTPVPVRGGPGRVLPYLGACPWPPRPAYRHRKPACLGFPNTLHGRV